MTRLRLTARVRLTLLYTSLFAACGAIVVAITYLLVAQLPVYDPGARDVYVFAQSSDPKAFAAQCEQNRHSAHPDRNLLHKCENLQRYLGAQSQRDATLSHLLQYSLITLAVVMALAAIAGWIIAGRVLRPVHQITAAARAASEHNLSTRVALTGPRDELHELAETFDDMLGRLEAAFEGQRRFIANASHELRTPLTVMRTTIDVVLAKPDRTADELRGMGQDVRSAIDQAEALVDALLTLARNEHGLNVRDQVDLATVAEDVLDATTRGDRHLHTSLDRAVTRGDPMLLERLLANLVDNATRYNIPGGDVWLSTSTHDDRARLEVANTGPHIDPTDVDALFQPFRRLTDRTGRDGFGLGLAIVESIVAIHGGTVTAHPRPDGGLAVTVALPGEDSRGFPE